jgi:hypothetical protein
METIKILHREILARGKGVLEKITLKRRRFDGETQELTREVYDTGDAASILSMIRRAGASCWFGNFGRPPPADRQGSGGGLREEGEDIEILEPTLDEALAMIENGEIIDAKTIILLHHAKLVGLMQEKG